MTITKEAAQMALGNLDVELCERQLRRYISKCWNVVEPTTPFVPGWHIDCLSEYLEAVFPLQQIKDLIITMPPRHMKSLSVSVFWPTWVWINHPHHRWIFSSYAAGLATRDSVKCRRIIESMWYQARWGECYTLNSDQNVKNRFENDKTGYRISTSVGGSVTGEGGDTIVVDDPHNLKEIHSKKKRETATSWWDEVMSTRKNDPRTASRVIVMQRGHQDDLAGHLLKQGGYEHLNLPTQVKKKTTVYFPVTKTILERPEGGLLWEERFSPEIVKQQRKELGSYGAAAQLDQNPVPADGGIFKREWWKYFKEAPKFKRLMQSWDTGFKKGEENDPSVCITGGETDTGYYIVDCWCDLVAFPELVRTCKAQHSKHNPNKVLVEDKASGQSLVQVIKAETKIPVLAISIDSDKVARANAVSPTVEAGNVYLLEGAPWLADFLDEFDHFPNGTHDDRVDSLTQLLSMFLGILKKNIAEPNIRAL